MGNNSSTDRSSLTKGEQSFLDAASAGDLEAVKRFCENLPPGASSAAELINNVNHSFFHAQTPILAHHKHRSMTLII